jgi:hypothetical protein
MTRHSILLVALATLSACSSGKKEEAPRGAIAAIASASPAMRAAEAPPPAEPPPPEKPSVRRPKDEADLILTPEKRARVERLAPEAKGFIAGAELEQKLFAMNLTRGKDAEAAKAFDKLARGKWILFTGNIGAPTPGSFQLPIRYTPRDPMDSMGITTVWIPIELSNVKAFDPSQYQPGDLAVVLAKYEGKQKASGGYDVVLSKAWFE